MSASFTILDSTPCISEKNFHINPVLQNVTSLFLQSEADNIGKMAIDMKLNSSTYLYFLNSQFELKIADISQNVRETKQMSWI